MSNSLQTKLKHKGRESIRYVWLRAMHGSNNENYNSCMAI